MAGRKHNILQRIPQFEMDTLPDSLPSPEKMGCLLQMETLNITHTSIQP